MFKMGSDVIDYYDDFNCFRSYQSQTQFTHFFVCEAYAIEIQIHAVLAAHVSLLNCTRDKNPEI
jgi:hypothetical protein